MYQDKPDLNELVHYGVKRRSGRYPWGSGGEPFQRSGDFLSRVEELKRGGKSEKDIAAELGVSTTLLRTQIQVAKHERRALEADRVRSLRDDGKSLNEIAAIMGYKNDSSIRALLDEGVKERTSKAATTAEILKKQLEEKGMLDVGVGSEKELNVSPQKLEEALLLLEMEGYNVYGIGVPQVTNPKQQTIMKVLTKPEVTYGDAYNNKGDIQSVGDYHSTDNGKTFQKLERPSTLSSDRISIRYGNEGGVEKDGVIELRRGVADLDLGNSRYAQVRIMVDNSHYLKGMAMYSDDIPDGVDIVFNTNKNSDTPKMKVLKAIKDDPDNPFGAAIKANGQSYYIDKDGKKKLSPVNKLKEEGDWDSMSKNLSSQFLSKQPIELINKQLKLTYTDYAAQYDEIMSIDNPTIKRKMLLDFADTCDGAVVHLKAASLPRQKTQVILPFNSMKETEVYAPNFKNGEQIALTRYPHAGTFEIPILTVNNKNKKAKDTIGNALDAIGINYKVAERLSGADFDGDFVIAIPTNDKVRIKSTKALKDLENFNPKEQYAEHPGMRYLTKANTQKQMGVVSNLITDMTLRGADESEIARAVKHSMVVIDAEKHKLDYKQSEKDNGIAELKKRYQGYTNEYGEEKGGASTLLSRRKQTIRVPERQGSGLIDSETGKVTYKESGRTYKEREKVIDPVTKKQKIDPDTGKPMYKETGKILKAETDVKLLNEIDDVRVLSSGTAQENAYADYANKMKALANESRKSYKSTGRLKYDSAAKEEYAYEVSTLNAKLNVAEKNAPKERRAQLIATTEVSAKKQANPDMDKKEIKKASQIAIVNARYNVGASGKESKIPITDKEWEAIQKGAITDTTLTKILRYADTDKLRERATPRNTTQLSKAKIDKAKSMIRSGYSNDEIAESLGVSTSTVIKYLKPKESE